MAEKNRFSKPVSFNRNNDEDQQILKHVDGRNFSGYVKSLILADILDEENKKADKGQNEVVKTDAKMVIEKDDGIKIVIG